MIEQVLIEKIESGWLGIRNEVDFMPLLGKGFAQLSGHDAAATKGWVAHNSYFDLIHCFGLSLITSISVLKFQFFDAQ